MMPRALVVVIATANNKHKENSMDEKAKLGAAVVGGYILGRTKKGMAAARLAMWLSGSPQVMNAARTALSAPEVRQVTDQVSGPLADAARKAAVAAVLNRVGALSNNLAQRTEKLTGQIEGTAETVTDTVGDTTETVGDTTEKVAEQPVKAGSGLAEALKKRRGKKKEPEASEEKPEEKPEGEPDGDAEGDTEGEDQTPGDGNTEDRA